MSTKNWKCVVSLVVLGLFLGGVPAQAATITWGSATTIAGDTDVSTLGTLLYAEHWGGTNNTVNGVAFTAAGTNITASGSVGINPNIGAAASLSTAYQDILKGNWYNASGYSATLHNLISGQQYQTQVWVEDPRYSTSQYTSIIGGPDLYIRTSTSTNLGQYAIGTFTADATTQAISFGQDGVVNAIQVRAVTQPGDIPEPATMALLGLAGAGLGGYIRRRRS